MEAIVHGMGPLRLTSRHSAGAATAAASLSTPTSTTAKIAILTPSSMPHERRRPAAATAAAAAAAAAPAGASGGSASRERSATHPGFDSIGVGGRGPGRAAVAIRGENREVKGSAAGNAGGSGSTGGSVTVGGGPVTSSGNKGSAKSRIGGRGMIPPPIETRPMPNLADEGDLTSGRR